MELLRDARWQQKRLEVFVASGWKCQRCGCEPLQVGGELHVHHHRYRNVMPWEYTLDELAAVCSRCHDDLTEQRAKLKEALFRYESAYLPLDRVIGYVLAQVEMRDGGKVDLGTVTVAAGVGDAVGCDVREVLAHCLLGSSVDVGDLLAERFHCGRESEIGHLLESSSEEAA
jgi:hypothetical protein